MKFGKQTHSSTSEKGKMGKIIKFAWLPTECLVRPGGSSDETIIVWLETYEEYELYVPNTLTGGQLRFFERVALFNHFR
jgi:hypothetical protein